MEKEKQNDQNYLCQVSEICDQIKHKCKERLSSSMEINTNEDRNSFISDFSILNNLIKDLEKTAKDFSLKIVEVEDFFERFKNV